MPQSQAPSPPPPRSAAASRSAGERKRQLDEWRRQRQEQQQQQCKPPPFRPVSVRPRAASSSSASSVRTPQPPTGRRRTTMAATASQTAKPPPSTVSDSSSESRLSPGGERSPPSPALVSPVAGAPGGDGATLRAEDVAVLESFFDDHETHACELIAQRREEKEALFATTQQALEDGIVSESFQENDPSAVLSPRRRSREGDTRALERNLLGEFDDGALDAASSSESEAAAQTQERRDDCRVDEEQVLAMLLDQVAASRAARANDAPSELDKWLQDDRALQNEEETVRRDSGETTVVEAPIAFSLAAIATATTSMEAGEETALASSPVKHHTSDSGDQTSDEELDFEDAATHAKDPSQPVLGAHQPSDEHEEARRLQEEAEHEDPRRRSARQQCRRSTKALVTGVSGLLALALLTCAAACWSSLPGAQALRQQAAATCLAALAAIERALIGIAARWTGVWSRELAASSLAKAKTLYSNASESLQRHSSNYVTSVLHGLSSAASSSARAVGSVWESVFPSSKDTDLIAATHAQLLDPFDADQRALNDKLKALMLKQEAWGLEELKRMKKRRALQASATESILTSTRTLVLNTLHEAKVIAEHHVASYTEAISDQLLQAIQRELEEHEQRMDDERQQATRSVAEQEAGSLEKSVRQELDALEQRKGDEEQILDLELSADKSQIATARESLARELAAMAEREKAKIEAAYAQVSADVASKLEQVEHVLIDVESQVAGMASQKLDEEDALLLEELKKMEELAATRVAAEQERTLAGVADAAMEREEQLRLERRRAEELARALEKEEARVAAERRNAEEEIAEAARREVLRLEAERREAEEALIVARQQEQQRLELEELRAEEKLAKIKQEETELAQREREEGEAAIAEVARVEEQLLAQEAAAEDEWLRAERAAAEAALERALVEERAKLLEQLDEGEQRFQELAVGVRLLAPEAAAPAAVELLPRNPDAPAVAEVVSIASMVPQVELFTLGLVVTALLVLVGAAVRVLRANRRRLEACRRQHAPRALPKRWQQAAEASDSDSVEEVELLALAPPSTTGSEPEAEVLGSPDLSEAAVERSASEDTSQASSVEERDESSMAQQVDALSDESDEEDIRVASPLAARRPNAAPRVFARRRALRISRTTTTTTTTAAAALAE